MLHDKQVRITAYILGAELLLIIASLIMKISHWGSFVVSYIFFVGWIGMYASGIAIVALLLTLCQGWLRIPQRTANK